MSAVFVRPVIGGFLVRTRTGTPYVFVGYDTSDNPRGAVARYLEKVWFAVGV